MEQSPPATTVANPRLLGLMRETVLPPLFDAFTDVVDGLREPLLEQAGRQGGDVTPFIDGLYTLRQHREAVLSAYRRHLLKTWQLLESGSPLSSQLSFDNKALKVDLVDHDELEVQLAIHHLADALTREWQAQLLALNSYLTWVDPGLRMAADSNPFSPAQIAMAVYEGFSAITLPGPMRVSSVICCERDLIELVGPIYESVYSVLTREFGAPESGSTQSRQSHIPSAENEVAEPEPDWLARFFGQWEGTDSETPASPSARPEDGQATGEGATLPQALHRLLEDSRASREQVHGRDPVSAGPRSTLSQRELLSILTLLQIAPESAIAAMVDAQEPLLPRLKKQMFETAGQLGVQADAVKLSAADENIVDLIGMLFQVIFEECQLGADQRVVLGKLIAPMTKVALQDRQLFLQSSHPARRLLNVLTEACEGNQGETAEEKELLDKVAATVERLTLEFDESQSVFRSLRGDFNAYYAEYRRQAELAEREAGERQRLEDALERARKWARTTLQSKLETNPRMPAPVRKILQSGWTAHASALEAGGRGHTALMQIDGLLQALETAQRDGASPSSWDAVADWLQPVWMSTGKTRSEIIQARAALLETLRELAAKPAAPAPAEPDPVPAPAPVEATHVIGPLTAEELQAVDFDNVTAEYFSRLPVGTWLDFIDKDNKVQSGKLSWVSPISSRLLFVSRAGTRIAVASPQELAVMVKLERVRLHRDDDAFYSAMQGVIDRLEPAVAA